MCRPVRRPFRRHRISPVVAGMHSSASAARVRQPAMHSSFASPATRPSSGDARPSSLRYSLRAESSCGAAGVVGLLAASRSVEQTRARAISIAAPATGQVKKCSIVSTATLPSREHAGQSSALAARSSTTATASLLATSTVAATCSSGAPVARAFRSASAVSRLTIVCADRRYKYPASWPIGSTPTRARAMRSRPAGLYALTLR